MKKIKYSEVKSHRQIIHVVGGAMTEDLEKNIEELANWFIDNDIVLLWGDSYLEKNNKNHPVARLAQLVKEKGGEVIRVLQLGKDYARLDNKDQLEELVDEEGTTIGYHDNAIKDEFMIYTHQQQDRQKGYYNISDGLMAINGGIGVGYEIPNALIYTFSGDLPSYFKIIVLDNQSKFKNFIESYLALVGAKIENFKNIDYYSSSEDFVQKNKATKDKED